MIKTGGENVRSVKVEEILLRDPAVANAAVAGLPKHVALLERLPMTSTGKIQKNVLRDAHQDLFAALD